MNVKKALMYYAGYSVGIYLLQGFVLKKLLPLPLPMVTDPLGTLIGYAPTVAPAGGVSTPSTVALVTSQGA